MDENPHIKAYGDFLASKASLKRPLRVVCDASNGPAGMVVEALAKRLSPQAEFHLINDALDPDFPAHGPDPNSPSAVVDIAKKVIETKADLGVIFDGDGDRAVFVDEGGIPIPPQIMAMFLFENTPGTHIADALVYESTIHAMPALKDRVVASKVGRYFISLAMREKEAEIGAELSGHFFFRDFFGLDSAVLMMIKVMNMLSDLSVTASQAFSRYAGHSVISGKVGLEKPFSEALGALKAFAEKKGARVSELDGLSADFGDSWINLRPSNTEPIVRVTAGAKDSLIAETLSKEFKKVLE